MAKPWTMSVSLDATGYDRCTVTARRPTRTGGSPHVVVTTGPVVLRALDTDALTDLVSAWAAARVRGAEHLPLADRRPLQTGARRHPTRGAAYPVGDVILEGRQRWDVRLPDTARPFLTVTTGWLAVRVWDRVALDVHLQAYAEAAAVGRHLFGAARVPSMDQLIERAQIRATRESAAAYDARIDRRGGGPQR